MNLYYKIALTIVTLALMASCAEPTVVQKKKLPVRVTNLAKYTAVKAEGQDKFVRGEFDATHMTQLTYFNENGQTKKKFWYDKKRKIIYQLIVEHDAQKRDSIGVLKNDKMAIQGRIQYTVNEQGKKTEERHLSKKGKPTKTNQFEYDANGNMIKETELDKNGKTKLITTYKNDENGNIINMKTTSPDGSYSVEENYKFTKFNAQGDWTQKHVISDGVVTHLVNRQVNYFGEKKY